MAAFALSEYRFRGNTLMGLYLAIGIMIPIRLGTVAILQGMVAAGLVNTLTALILVYTAQGLPLAVFILSEFMRTVSDDLKNAGRIDGLSEYCDLLPPGAAADPAGHGNGRRLHDDPDLERSLVPADPRARPKPPRPSRSARRSSSASSSPTGTRFLRPCRSRSFPVLVLYVIFSRQLIRGITAGAVK